MTTGADIIRYEVPLPAGASRTAIEGAVHAAAERLGFGAGLATIVVKRIVSQVGMWLVEVAVYGRALAFICNLRVECLKAQAADRALAWAEANIRHPVIRDRLTSKIVTAYG